MHGSFKLDWILLIDWDMSLGIVSLKNDITFYRPKFVYFLTQKKSGKAQNITLTQSEVFFIFSICLIESKCTIQE